MRIWGDEFTSVLVIFFPTDLKLYLYKVVVVYVCDLCV